MQNDLGTYRFVLLYFHFTGKHVKVIPLYCIEHPYCARFLRHQRAYTGACKYVQNARDFPQTKLNNGINSPFLLNEHGDPRFFFQVFAKNSLYLKINKSLIVEHDFFWKIVPNWVCFGQGEDFKLTTELSEKVQCPATRQSKTA